MTDRTEARCYIAYQYLWWYNLQAHHEATQQQREYDETKRQIEEDADREILDIKNKYERRLRDEIETNMRLKGESGIMRKKVGTFPIFHYHWKGVY